MEIIINDLDNMKDQYCYNYQYADSDPECSGFVQGIEFIMMASGNWDTIIKWRDEN